MITGLIKEYGGKSLNSHAHALEEKARSASWNFADHIANAAQDMTDAITTWARSRTPGQGRRASSVTAISRRTGSTRRARRRA